MNKRNLWRLLILVPILALGLYQALGGDWFILECLVVGVVLGFIIRALILPLRIRRALVLGFSSPSYRSARPEEFPLLDNDALEHMTRQWEALGFVQCGDVVGGEATPSQGTAFARLFEHEREGALVELGQQFLPSKTLPFASSIVSYWGQPEREQIQRLAHALEQATTAKAPLAAPGAQPDENQVALGDALKLWTLVTHNRAPNRFSVLLRHPRTLGVRLESDASPAQLWQTHQERSALVEARLSMSSLRGDLPALLHAHAYVLSSINVRRLRATPVWKIARLQFSRKVPPPIFDGELAPLSG